MSQVSGYQWSLVVNETITRIVTVARADTGGSPITQAGPDLEPRVGQGVGVLATYLAISRPCFRLGTLPWLSLNTVSNSSGILLAPLGWLSLSARLSNPLSITTFAVNQKLNLDHCWSKRLATALYRPPVNCLIYLGPLSPPLLCPFVTQVV